MGSLALSTQTFGFKFHLACCRDSVAVLKLSC